MPNNGTLAMVVSPAVMGALQDVGEDALDVVGGRPLGVVLLEAARVADPPLVVAGPVGLLVPPRERPAGEPLAERDRLEHRAVAPPAAAHVVGLALAGVAVDRVDGGDEVGGVDVVPNLLALVAEHRVRPA